MILAIDTSAGTSAAVFDGQQLLAHVKYDDPFAHAESIGTAISEALSKAAVEPAQLTAIALGRGPAPYTGLRVGMAAGLALAEALGIEALGVATLDAVALREAGLLPALILGDARRREVFLGHYLGLDSDGLPLRQGSLRVLAPAGLDEEFGDLAQLSSSCDAAAIGAYAVLAKANGRDQGDTAAIYLRSPDVSPSKGKRVTG